NTNDISSLNNFNNPPPVTTYPFHILTLNVQGLNSKFKQEQLISMIKSDHISIMGLSETKLRPNQSRFIYKHIDAYSFYFNNDSDSVHGSGVGLIVSNSYSKYIQKSNGYKGRVIYIDLFMKGNVKLRIIQTYLHANFMGNRAEIEDLQRYIFNLLDQAKQLFMETIIMGDFNRSLEKFSVEYRRNGNVHWSYNLFHKLLTNNFTETVSLYHDITTLHPYNTFIPKQSTLSPSRIDFIWISQGLVMESISCNVIDIDTFETDHKAVYLSFLTHNLFKKQSAAYLKQHNIKKKVFTYDNMNQRKWEQFTSAAEDRFQSHHLNNMQLNNVNDLNRYWSLIQSTIMNAAFTTIDYHTTSMRNKAETRPQHLEETYSYIKSMNKLLTKLSTKNLAYYMSDLQQNWCNTRSNLLDIASKFRHPLVLPNFIDLHNGNNIHLLIKDLLKTIGLQYTAKSKAHQDKQIKAFVQQRCEDFYDDKKHMIDSFLERTKRTIVIDRVLHTDQQGVQSLVTDPNEIKRLTIDHFQNCAGGTHSPKEIPPRWEQQYRPKDTINPSVYNSLMTPMTNDEWAMIISALPLGKAAGPSGI